MKLPTKERMEIAYELLDSFGGEPEKEADIHPAWVAELERRARAALAGEPAKDWGEVRDRLRRKYAR